MIIDADVHVAPGAADLEPFMETRKVAEYFAQQRPGGHLIARAGYRADAYPPSGGGAGSDPAYMAEHLLNGYGIYRAVLAPHAVLGIGDVLDLDLAAEFASALNQWQVNECLPVDDRYVGSIVVAPGDPQRAADEIRRWASHDRMVQVYTTSAPCLLGDRFMHPIYKACDERGLPFLFHVTGTSLAAVNKSVIAAPSTYFESHASMCVTAMNHLISLVSEGVFVKYPSIHVIFAEFGTAWLPWVMWRMDMEYRANREDVPWLTRTPSEYIKDFVRFTTQPLEEPARPQDLFTLLSLIGGDRLLLYSSDYPHHDFDNPSIISRRLPEDWRDRVMFQNAADLFHIDVPARV